MSPIFRVPCFNAPPNIPPCSFSSGVPGLLISKLLATKNNGDSDFSGSVIFISISSFRILSMLTPCIAETGIMVAFSAIVPLTNSFIVL